jgi:hypothetical protein
VKTLIKTKPCFYCSVSIDTSGDDFIRIDTLKSVLNKGPQEYAHELCAAQADEEAQEDARYGYVLDAQLEREYFGPMQYEELIDGEY